MATRDLEIRERQGSVVLPAAALSDHAKIDRFINPFMCALVIVNCIMIGIATDIVPDSIGWVWMDLGFVIVYMAEVALKIWLLGARGFLRGREWGWNAFDCVIIGLAVVDLAVSFAFYGQDSESKPPSFIFVRLARITRFGRFVRLFQFKVFNELLVMLNGLVSALRTLAWAFVLLFFPIYTLGLLLTSLVGQASDASPLAKDAFGRLGHSMFMVFRCVTGDCTLANGIPVMAMLTDEFGWVYAAVYVLVIMLVTFGIFNLIMATFVDNALSTARRNENVRMRTRLNDKERQTALTSQLVHMLLERHNGMLPEAERRSVDDLEKVVFTKISKEVFDATMSGQEAQQLLEDLDVPEGDRTDLFDVLDADGGGTLQLDEIIGGIVKLRGDPRRSDVVHVGLVCRILQEQVARIGESIDAHVRGLKDDLEKLGLDRGIPPAGAIVVQRM
uniref:Ion transport domain-containing protein n=1 Tax=Alexandrium catenella TaxID=2925 RepID=A0A7S1WEF6_ALECA